MTRRSIRTSDPIALLSALLLLVLAARSLPAADAPKPLFLITDRAQQQLRVDATVNGRRLGSMVLVVKLDNDKYVVVNGTEAPDNAVMCRSGETRIAVLPDAAAKLGPAHVTVDVNLDLVNDPSTTPYTMTVQKAK